MSKVRPQPRRIECGAMGTGRLAISDACLAFSHFGLQSLLTS